MVSLIAIQMNSYRTLHYSCTFQTTDFSPQMHILQKTICLYVLRKLNRIEGGGTLKFKHRSIVQEMLLKTQSSLQQVMFSSQPQSHK